MAKQINFTHDNVKYTLEFNRKSVAKLARDGFSFEELSSKSVIMIPMLFAGAFQVHHPYMKRDKIEEIYSHMTNREKLIVSLAEMYNEPIASLIEEPEENEGNVIWEET